MLVMPGALQQPYRAEAADGIDELGPQIVRHHNTGLLTQMIADLEARLTEPAPP